MSRIWAKNLKDCDYEIRDALIFFLKKAWTSVSVLNKPENPIQTMILQVSIVKASEDAKKINNWKLMLILEIVVKYQQYGSCKLNSREQQ